MSEKWYFNETLTGLPPKKETYFEAQFVSKGTRFTRINLPRVFIGMFYTPVSGSSIIACMGSSWEDPAYRTIELDDPATGELLAFLQQNATNISSGPVDPTPVKLVNKVILGSDTVLDLTSDTVTPETLLVGTTAHNAKGEIITGTLVPCTVYSAESPAMDGTTSNSDTTFTWDIPSTEHGFKSKNLVVSVYLSTGEQIQCDVTISDTFTVTLTAVYNSEIVTRAGGGVYVSIPAGYLRAVIIGPVETPAAVQQAMLNQLPVYTGGG